MNGFEKIGMILVGAYVTFNEWRQRNFVTKDRFNDFTAQIVRMEGKLDKLLTHSGLDVSNPKNSETKNPR